MHSSLLAVLLPSSLLRDVPETVPTYTSLKKIVKLFIIKTSVLPCISVIKNSLIQAQSAGPFDVGDVIRWWITKRSYQSDDPSHWMDFKDNNYSWFRKSPSKRKKFSAWQLESMNYQIGTTLGGTCQLSSTMGLSRWNGPDIIHGCHMHRNRALDNKIKSVQRCSKVPQAYDIKTINFSGLLGDLSILTCESLNTASTSSKFVSSFSSNMGGL